MITVGMVSLGCPKNLVDSEAMLGSLPAAIFRFTPHLSEAEVIIVNTCAFVEAARRESEAAINHAAACRRGKCRALVVAGCLVQYWGQRACWALPAADLLLGVGEWPALGAMLGLFLKSHVRPRPRVRSIPRYPLRKSCARGSFSSPHSAYLKIAEGCDNRCRYCLIGRLRGPYRSRPVSLLVEEARELVARGAREVVLVAQDTTYYGREKNGKSLLPRLLEELDGIEGLRWIRLLYAHPAHIDQGIVRAAASSAKICPYLDIPLQHISDRILKRMGRRVTRRAIEELLDQVREMIPSIALRTTLMVGFPGEGEEEHRELKEFVRWQRFDHLGVFAYSPERLTPAARYSRRPPPAVAVRRRDELMRQQQIVSRHRLKRFVGKEMEVLVDAAFPERGSPLMLGHSRFQAPEIDGLVVLEGTGLKAGDLVKVRITHSATYDLYGVKI